VVTVDHLDTPGVCPDTPRRDAGYRHEAPVAVGRACQDLPAGYVVRTISTRSIGEAVGFRHAGAPEGRADKCGFTGKQQTYTEHNFNLQVEVESF
jgi:hypothetical protein